jgi:hypothetical protein
MDAILPRSVFAAPVSARGGGGCQGRAQGWGLGGRAGAGFEHPAAAQHTALPSTPRRTRGVGDCQGDRRGAGAGRGGRRQQRREQQAAPHRVAGHLPAAEPAQRKRLSSRGLGGGALGTGGGAAAGWRRARPRGRGRVRVRSVGGAARARHGRCSHPAARPAGPRRPPAPAGVPATRARRGGGGLTGRGLAPGFAEPAAPARRRDASLKAPRTQRSRCVAWLRAEPPSRAAWPRAAGRCVRGAWQRDFRAPRNCP